MKDVGMIDNKNEFIGDNPFFYSGNNTISYDFGFYFTILLIILILFLSLYKPAKSIIKIIKLKKFPY